MKEKIFKFKNLLSLFIVLIFSLFSFLILSKNEIVFAENIISVSSQSPVDYTLSYPGLLPDNPLYFLKVTRDGVMGFFISNPLKKAQFDLLQADKRVEASYLLLFQENKLDLAGSTFSKGENYFEDAVTKTEDAKKQGMDIHDLAKNLVLANLKHREVFSIMINKIGEKNKLDFRRNGQRLIDLGEKVKLLRP